MTANNKSTKSKKANVQPNPEGGPEPVPEAGARKTPRLSPGPKAEADRIIAKGEKKARKERGEKATQEPEEDLVVFAFRLTPDEREAIHKAAGPAKASKFVRTLAVAAARKDKGAVNELIAAIA
jgi:hypothetical protein